METLIATVLIMVIFVVSSLILNNLFSNSIKNNTRGITAKINEVEYQYKNDKITLPFYDAYKTWKINIEMTDNREKVNINAKNTQTNKTVKKTIYKR
ncbi:MAG: hypothetical protein ACX93I_07870 [Winogradskyella sp.]